MSQVNIRYADNTAGNPDACYVGDPWYAPWWVPGPHYQQPLPSVVNTPEPVADPSKALMPMLEKILACLERIEKGMGDE